MLFCGIDKMRISNIKIKNFKSFGDLPLDFENPNVIIGSCSSGKSNLFEAFQFLKDMSFDFKEAVKIHGASFIKNIKSQNEPVYFKITFDNKYSQNSRFGFLNLMFQIHLWHWTLKKSLMKFPLM